EEGETLQQELVVELQMVDEPGGQVVLRGGLEQPLIGLPHRGQRAAARRRVDQEPEVERRHLPSLAHPIRPNAWGEYKAPGRGLTAEAQRTRGGGRIYRRARRDRRGTRHL